MDPMLLIDCEIANSLISVGIPANVQGFPFIKSAVMAVIKEPKLLRNLTKLLYPKVGELYGVTGSAVERGIRTAISISDEREGMYGINELMNNTYYTGKEKLTNGFFLGLIAELVKKTMLDKLSSQPDSPDKQRLVKYLQNLILGNHNHNDDDDEWV